MVILLGGGLWSAVVIQKEVFPESQLDVVEVRVGYPGASPSEVEQGILRPIEGAVRSVDGIQRIISEAREGRGEVLIELVAGQHRMKAFQDIDQAVSRIRTFPDQIEQPEVRLQSEQREVDAGRDSTVRSTFGRFASSPSNSATHCRPTNRSRRSNCVACRSTSPTSKFHASGCVNMD